MLISNKTKCYCYNLDLSRYTLLEYERNQHEVTYYVNVKMSTGIDKFTIIRSHIEDGANTIVIWNERTKQSITIDKLRSLFFFCVCLF